MTREEILTKYPVQKSLDGGDPPSFGLWCYFLKLEWQYFGENSWGFGRQVRGVIRDSLIAVHWGAGSWYWYLNQIPAEPPLGKNSHLEYAVTESEKVLAKFLGLEY